MQERGEALQQGQGRDSTEGLCSLGDNPCAGLVLSLERLKGKATAQREMRGQTEGSLS